MEKVLEEIEFLIGEKFIEVSSLLNHRSFDVFSDLTISFLSDISKQLLNSTFVREYPDVATFAFYCRMANLKLLKRSFSTNDEIRMGRGILFHIAPGNVPINFAYSLLAGLLTGNINIVRIPSKNFEQVTIIINVIKDVLNSNEYKSIFSNRIFIVKYNRESEATGFFSKLCDVRIIWGGDQTITDIRKFPIAPKASEVTFADRYSIAIIDAYSYLRIQDKTKVALDFYNDTFLFDQNACTSPQTIFWHGSPEDVDSAKSEFWSLLERTLKAKNFELQPVLSIDKLTTFYAQAIMFGDIKKEQQSNNEIWRVKNSAIHHDIEKFKCSSGYFNEVTISALDDLLHVVNRKYQTIGYLGFSKKELENWVFMRRPTGVDRIVPLGRTMDFSLSWDGIDLVSAFSRRIEII
jgi:hypothetical protein